MNKKISFFLRVGVSIALLYYLFKRVPYEDLINIYVNSQKFYIFLGFIIIVFTIILGISRWRFFLYSLGIKISYREAVGIYLSSHFFNLFFPSIVAGDIFRSMSITARHGDLKKAASSVFMDRFSGAFALIAVAFFSFLAGWHLFPDRKIGFYILLLCLCIGLVSLAAFNKKVFLFLTNILKEKLLLKKKLVNFHEQLYFFKKNPQIFLKSMLYSVPIQILAPCAVFVFSKAFGLNIGIIYFLIFIPVVTVIALIPVTIAGFGLRENAAVFFFCLIGVKPGISTSLSLLNGVFLIFLGVIGGIFYVSVYHRWFQSHS